MTTTTPSSAAGSAGSFAASDEDLAEIRQAVVDYCEGYYRRDPEQTARAYHGECVKRKFLQAYDAWHLVVRYPASMIDLARNDEPPIDPTYEIFIDDVADGIASVRLYSDRWVDFLHVVKHRGHWKLFHVTFDELPPEDTTPTEEDREGITQAALDYVEAWYTGDAERHARAYHDECIKRIYAPNGSIELVSPAAMYDYCAAGDTVLDGAEWTIEIDDIVGSVASVRIPSTLYVDYVHVAKARGKWGLFHVTYCHQSDDRP